METIKDITYIIAASSAALYFIFKFCTGYFLIDLSVKIECNRIRSMDNDEMDFIEVIGKLEKGKRGSLQLFDFLVKLQFGDNILKKSFLGIKRQSYNKGGKEINWNLVSKQAPCLTLTPSEKTQFSCYFEVTRNTTCDVEICLIGKKILIWFHKIFKMRVAQWKASCISFPIISTV